jgi:coenzyme Q-binding protein COQ10
MRSHTDRRIFHYTQEQLFALVSDVQSYPEFIPWVKGARISDRSDDGFTAKLMVRFNGISETYTSRVVLTKPEAVDVTLVSGPFNHLENHWRFTPQSDGSCVVDFHVAFEFKNVVLDKLIGGLFARATEKMIEAFSKRAGELYGT